MSHMLEIIEKQAEERKARDARLKELEAEKEKVWIQIEEARKESLGKIERRDYLIKKQGEYLAFLEERIVDHNGDLVGDVDDNMQDGDMDDMDDMADLLSNIQEAKYEIDKRG